MESHYHLLMGKEYDELSLIDKYEYLMTTIIS